MPWFNLPGGGVCHVNLANPRARRCRSCGAPADLLCDFPVGAKTCDAPCCANCSKKVDGDKDYCLAHSGQQVLDL